MLTISEIAAYHAAGFIVLQKFFDGAELSDVGEELLRHTGPAPLADKKRYEITYPALASAPLARLTSSSRLIAAIADVLGADPVLSSFTGYVRTPGHSYRDDTGLHCDAQMWRPVSSSATWLFAIVPLTDFSENAGPLLLSKGSHLLSTWESWPLGVRVLRRPRITQVGEPRDVRLRRGDLLLMNSLLWHAAPGVNRSGRPRVALFHKYAAADAPPGCGPFLIPRSCHRTFDRSVQNLLPYCAETPPQNVRVMLLVQDGIVMQRTESGRWTLPGGVGAAETIFRRWDGTANMIASAERYAAACVTDDISWMTWGWDTANDHSRVYVHAFRGEPHLRDGGAIVSRRNLRHDDASMLDAFLERPDVRAGGVSQRRWSVAARAM